MLFLVLVRKRNIDQVIYCFNLYGVAVNPSTLHQTFSINSLYCHPSWFTRWHSSTIILWKWEKRSCLLIIDPIVANVSFAICFDQRLAEKIAQSCIQYALIFQKFCSKISFEGCNMIVLPGRRIAMFAMTSDFQDQVGSTISDQLLFVIVVKKATPLSTACFWYSRNSNIVGCIK